MGVSRTVAGHYLGSCCDLVFAFTQLLISPEHCHFTSPTFGFFFFPLSCIVASIASCLGFVPWLHRRQVNKMKIMKIQKKKRGGRVDVRLPSASLVCYIKKHTITTALLTDIPDEWASQHHCYTLAVNAHPPTAVEKTQRTTAGIHQYHNAIVPLDPQEAKWYAKLKTHPMTINVKLLRVRSCFSVYHALISAYFPPSYLFCCTL